MQSNMRWNCERNLLEFPSIELVRMAVKDKGSGSHNVFGAVSTHKSWQEAMISSSPSWPVLPQASKCSNRNLHNAFVPRETDPDRSDWPIGDPVPCSAHWKNT